MESNVRLLVSASVVDETFTAKIIHVYPGFGAEPWVLELDNRISGPMGPQKTAAYVAERYLIDHPTALAEIGRAIITAAIQCALNPASGLPEGLVEL